MVITKRILMKAVNLKSHLTFRTFIHHLQQGVYLFLHNGSLSRLGIAIQNTTLTQNNSAAAKRRREAPCIKEVILEE
jgi:hypothetical protein